QLSQPLVAEWLRAPDVVPQGTTVGVADEGRQTGLGEMLLEAPLLQTGRDLLGQWSVGGRVTHRRLRDQSAGNQSAISRSADSGLSEPCTRFSRLEREKSPRMVPGAALRPSVAPLRPRTTSTASSPSRTTQTSGPLVTK